MKTMELHVLKTKNMDHNKTRKIASKCGRNAIFFFFLEKWCCFYISTRLCILFVNILLWWSEIKFQKGIRNCQRNLLSCKNHKRHIRNAWTNAFDHFINSLKMNLRNTYLPYILLLLLCNYRNAFRHRYVFNCVIYILEYWYI